ncbi:MAG: TGS domain-containing protein, partial [Saprospiraceae bacterium]|nr:TGS domain-containing protein [Saprospiraceae bacterium]
MIQITFPDGNARQFEPGVTSFEIARSISEGLSQKVLAAKVNGEVWDLSRPISKNATLQLLTWDDKDGKTTFWHSTAHLMAEALESLYPNIKFGTGPAIESGFYYDVDTGTTPLSSEDFVKIENEMIRLARLKNQYVRKDISKEEAVAYFTNKGDEYKLELIEKRGDESLTLYTQGQFTDLCKGPHLPDTGFIKAVKLTKLGGAYWQGDDTRQQLTRIYGISFPKQKDLTEYEFMMAEAKKRDHRKLGAELELFMFSELVGPGLPIWLPKGNALRERLMNFLKAEQEKRGYKLVTTPHIGRKELYVTSGHYAKYGKDSFQPILTPKEDEEFLLKPMNCPHHCEIFAHKPHSYKELPMRIAEFGTVYRYEQSGELHGLSRVRGFTQDDA